MKIAAELRDKIAEKAATGASNRAIATWLWKEHKVKVSHQAVGKIVTKNRSVRTAIAKSVITAYAEKNLPADLDRLQRAFDKNIGLLELTQAAAASGRVKGKPSAPTLAQVEAVCKLTATVIKADEHRRKALGLDQPENDAVAEFQGIGELLGLNFKPA